MLPFIDAILKSSRPVAKSLAVKKSQTNEE
jgi:hypothetical protein